MFDDQNKIKQWFYKSRSIELDLEHKNNINHKNTIIQWYLSSFSTLTLIKMLEMFEDLN